MKKLLIITGLGEIATGVALMVIPSLVGRLLLGAELTGAAVPVARVAGIALLALGLGCWPGPAWLGMLTYSALATLYLGWLGFGGGFRGILLWPAVALHAGLTVLLVLSAFRGNRASRLKSAEELRPPKFQTKIKI